MSGILNAFPIQNGLDYGTESAPSLAEFIAPFSLPSSIDSTSIRVDHSLGQKSAHSFDSAIRKLDFIPPPISRAPQQAVMLRPIHWVSPVNCPSAWPMNSALGYARSDSSQIGKLTTSEGLLPRSCGGNRREFQLQYRTCLVFYVPGIGDRF